LIALSLLWELWLAPLRPGGSWLVLKVLPLLLPLPGMLAGRRYTHQWASMLALAYLTEGIVRATSDPGPSARYAAIEIVLVAIWFFASVFYARLTRPGAQAPGREGAADGGPPARVDRTITRSRPGD
jgi:uncharacterized membrane protein